MSTKGPLPKAAAGPAAVLSALGFGTREMGLVRMLRGWAAINQRGGFDCPSCAWADPDGRRHTAEFCENGAKALADDATRRTIGRDFFRQYSMADLREQSEFWLNAQGRIAEPMLWRSGDTHFRPIAWEDAFAMIGGALRSLESPDRAAFYTSGKASNESAFLFQLLARTLGTNNLPDCSNMCHESSGAGLKETIGVGKSTVTLDDLEHVIGQNPGTNHPRMLTSLETAKRRGAKIIAVNPLKEVGLLRFSNPQRPMAWLSGGGELADQYLQVRINGDVAALKGIAKALLELGATDHTFVDAHTEGFAPFAEDLAATPWPDIERAAGIDRQALIEAARTIHASGRLVISWAMGLTQHENAVDNIRALVNLVLLTGNIGRPGSGLLCVRGHSNVQGDRTMGVGHDMPEPFLAALEREFGIAAPRTEGLDTVRAIHAMRDGGVDVFLSLGGNFLSATPDTEVVRDGLLRCRLNASIVTKLNRSHLFAGDASLLLPCLGRSEIDRQESGVQFTTMENTVSVVSSSEGVFEPVSPDVRSEVAIVAGIARHAVGGRGRIDWQALSADYDRIRDHVSRVVPGFEQFNERVRQPGGFYLPIPAKDRVFPTPSGKARLSITPLPDWQLDPDQFLLMTVRTHDQFNTVVYGMNDRYRGISNDRRVVFISAADLRARGWADGDRVNVTSHFQGRTRMVEDFRLVEHDIPRGCLAAYFPETNPLVPLESVAAGSNTPASKSVVVTLARRDVSPS
jgi:molybdopterin-dependent oxidoreductase alpha subunit